ncbi:MAG TPA: hypothetical protein DCY05_03815 [Spirochaetaceae bacterium]|nr:hypothetical protein [Spirochaetaceae bacterium]
MLELAVASDASHAGRSDATSNTCIACGACTKSCPMGLDVQAGVAAGRLKFDECMYCNECVAACPRAILKIGFGRR